MSTIIHEPRYTIEQAEYGWDVIDSQTGESVGICPDKKAAAARAQQLSALYLANTRRLAGSSRKVELYALGTGAGAERLAALFDDPDETLMAMRVQGALLAVKGIGVNKAATMLRAAGVTAAARKVRDLSPRQRALIATMLRSWAGSWSGRAA